MPRYWVTEFLLNDKLTEQRATNFKGALGAYRAFVILNLLIVTYMMLCTFFTVFGGITEAVLGEYWAWWLTVGPMTVVDPSGVTHEGSTVIASVTTTTTSLAK